MANVDYLGDLDIEFLDAIDSTNRYLAARSTDLRDFQTVATTNQTEGRGRLGRDWHSTPGLGLALSIAVPRGATKESDGLVPLEAGLSVLVSLERFGLKGGGLKWPNDVLVSGKKLAGVLCHVASESHIIAGVGLNVSYSRNQIPFENATSLKMCGITGVGPRELCEGILVALRAAHLDSMGSDYSRLDDVKRRMLTIGSRVRVHESDGAEWTGLAKDIDGEGHLVVVRDGESKSRHLVAGDILHLRNEQGD